MYFKTAFLFSMVASAMAMPTGNQQMTKRASVLTAQDYSQFQVSNGVGGNALAEVQAKFPVSMEITQTIAYPNTPPNPPTSRSTKTTYPPSTPKTYPSSKQRAKPPKTPRPKQAASTRPSQLRGGPTRRRARSSRSARSRTRCSSLSCSR